MRFPDYGTADLTVFGLEPVLFPSFEMKTRKTLFAIVLFLGLASKMIEDLLLAVLHFLSLILNIIQIVVLTRKSMRSNATNVMLIMMSVNQILFFMNVIAIGAISTDFEVPPRITQLMKDKPIANVHTSIIEAILKRNYFWIPIVMGFTKLVFMNKSGKSGFMAAFLVVSINILIGFGAFSLLTSDGLSPSKEYYQVMLSNIFIIDSISMVISYIVPALCFFSLTILLIRNSLKTKTDAKDHTLKLIITIFIFITVIVVPQSFGAVLTMFCGSNRGFYYIGEGMIDILDDFNLLNSSIICVIVFKITPNYKTTIYNIFKCGKKVRENSIGSEDIRAPKMNK